MKQKRELFHFKTAVGCKPVEFLPATKSAESMPCRRIAASLFVLYIYVNDFGTGQQGSTLPSLLNNNLLHCTIHTCLHNHNIANTQDLIPFRGLTVLPSPRHKNGNKKRSCDGLIGLKLFYDLHYNNVRDTIYKVMTFCVPSEYIAERG